MYNESDYKRYCSIKVRLNPFRMKDDFETVKTVAAIDAISDRAEILCHGTTESRFGWNEALKISKENMFSKAEELLEALESGEFPLKGFFAEPGGALIDHSIFALGDEVHIFYNRGFVAYDWPERFVDSIGHAVSKDLVNWEIRKPAINARAGYHDDFQTWSPAVINHNNKWYMFYTGVNYNIAQAPCMAVSDDLDKWERSGPSPLFIPGKWCPWSKDKWSDGRDSMVFKDDDRTFYMYYCSGKTTEDGGYRTATGIASSVDLYNWEDRGCFALEQCKLSPESPFVIKHNGVYYLFYTNCQDQGTYYATSDDPVTGWIEHGKIIDNVSCSEVFEFNGQWYITECAHLGCDMHFLGIHKFTWNDDGSVSVGEYIK